VEQNLGVPFQPQAAGRHLNRHGFTPEAIDDPIDTLANPAELVDGLIRPLANSRVLLVTSGASRNSP